jgi:homogentisate phytyltransferase/homogentisate geranylgeranyltransferase
MVFCITRFSDFKVTASQKPRFPMIMNSALTLLALCALISFTQGLLVTRLGPHHLQRIIQQRSACTHSFQHVTQLRSSAPIVDISQPHPTPSAFDKLFEPVKLLWEFSRPHTIVGSALSIVSLFLYAVPKPLWVTPRFLESLLLSLISSILMNIYITGLNQVTDVAIDKVNKPYLPIASGKLSQPAAIIVITTCLAISCGFAYLSAWPLRMTLLGSALLGSIYSLPPFRLKRFPLLAALCILVVRGSLVNLGFFWQAKVSMGSQMPLSWSSALSQAPESIWVTAFFAAFGVVIAILKDVPDVKGDLKYKIPTFSVRMGASKMLRWYWATFCCDMTWLIVIAVLCFAVVWVPSC